MIEDLIKNPDNRSLFADGVSNVLSGFVGSTPNTTGENIMGVVTVFIVWVVGGAAVFLSILFFIGVKLLRLNAIPVPVMGGISVAVIWFACSGIRAYREKS